jgi:hypothetical protein
MNVLCLTGYCRVSMYGNIMTYLTIYCQMYFAVNIKSALHNIYNLLPILYDLHFYVSTRCIVILILISPSAFLQFVVLDLIIIKQ